MKVLDRYVLREIVSPLLFSMAAVTLVFLAAEPLPRAARMLEKMPPATVLQFLLACIPVVMIYVYPMSTLVACMLAFTRLSRDSEIVAMMAGGISLHRVALPGLALTLVMSLLGLFIGDRIVPQANYLQHTLFLRSLMGGQDIVAGNVAVRRVDDDGTERVMLARSIDGDNSVLKQLTIVMFRDGVRQRVMLVDSAKWIATPLGGDTRGALEKAGLAQGHWTMWRVHTLEFDRQGNVIGASDTDEMKMPFDDPPDKLLERPRNREEMTRAQLLEQARQEAVMNDGQPTPRGRACMVEYYMRIALPFSCLVFGLFGIPLGLQPQRSGRAVGFAQSLGLLALYYLLMTSCCYLGEKDIIPAMLAVWVPNTLFATGGVWLMTRS